MIAAFALMIVASPGVVFANASTQMLHLGQDVYIESDGSVSFATLCKSEDALNPAFEGKFSRCHHVPVGTQGRIVEISDRTEPGPLKEEMRYVRIAVNGGFEWTNKTSLMPVYRPGSIVEVSGVFVGHREVFVKNGSVRCEILGMFCTDHRSFIGRAFSRVHMPVKSVWPIRL